MLRRRALPGVAKGVARAREPGQVQHFAVRALRAEDRQRGPDPAQALRIKSRVRSAPPLRPMLRAQLGRMQFLLLRRTASTALRAWLCGR